MLRGKNFNNSWGKDCDEYGHTRMNLKFMSLRPKNFTINVIYCYMDLVNFSNIQREIP